jgi:hypothetical protein
MVIIIIPLIPVQTINHGNHYNPINPSSGSDKISNSIAKKISRLKLIPEARKFVLAAIL